ncbi:DNA mismatch repair protein MutH [Clostridium tyrobutyricum]|nr:DNA mismatch repair protein MutH [Clostridium tyrobutyricum]
MCYEYDKVDKYSIERYAKRLLDRSLNDITNDVIYEHTINISEKSKGRLGNIVEQEYFGYKINSKKEADFKEAGVELKVCPIKQIKEKPSSNTIRGKLGYSAKERIVLSIIDYNQLNEENWEHNSLMKKCGQLLLMFYMYKKDINPRDLKFKIISLWKPSHEDLKIIERDWNIISQKVKHGKAHEISEGDTMYLGACTKGSTAEKSKREQPNSHIKAPQRAFSYKRSYVDYIIEEILQKQRGKRKITSVLSDQNLIFDEKVYRVFNSLLGKSVSDIIVKYSINRERKAKNFIRLIVDDVCKHVFGNKLENFDEFKKANIEIKTILLRPDGMPKESMSFEQIDYCEMANQEWEHSVIRERFENKKYLWIVFRSKVKFKNQKDLSLDDISLCKVMFWNMPISDLNGSMYRVWLDTKNKIIDGKYDDFIKISDNEISHIRPKAKDSKDLVISPQGDFQPKKSFWLNARYIKEQLKI